MALDDTEEKKSEGEAARVPQDGDSKSSSAPVTAREAIMAAIAETKKKAADAVESPPVKAKKEPKEESEDDAPPQEDADQKDEKPLQKADKPTEDGDADQKSEKKGKKDGDEEGAPAEKPKAPEPPASWSKSGKAQWESLPPSIQEEVLRREANAQKGVEELKSRHRAELDEMRGRTADLDASVAPYRDAIRRAGRTEGQVVDRLFQWHMALSGPHKVEAFKNLASTFGVDVSTLAGAAASQDSLDDAEGADSTKTPVRDLSWMPALEGISRRLEQYEAMTAAQQQAVAQKTVDAWSRDKPHFDRVRQKMAQMINMDVALLQQGQPAVNGFIKGDDVDMDAAYTAAVWADPELRAELLQEQREKDEETARVAAEQIRLEAEKRIRVERAKAEALQAKKAASSLKPGAPLSGLNGAANSKAPPRFESVRDSIRRALESR